MRVLRRVVGVGLVVGLCFAVFGEMHTWTSLDGKTAVAEFQALEDGTLVLQKGTKTIRVPLAQFSDEDQAYVHQLLADAKVEQEHLRQARLEKMQSLLGLNRGVEITERRWANWEDYYTESICGLKMLRFFKNERSIVDVADKGVFISVEDAVRPPDYAPTMVRYCPSDYDGEEKLGVYIHIAASKKAVSPSGGYQKMMDKYRLVYASPDGSSNAESDMRRCALALDALAQLRKDFDVDENRIYIGGTSGGGAESTFATFLYPQDFRAAFNSVRSFSLTSSSCLPFADDSDIRKAGKNQQPFAFISGPGDFNYEHMPRTEQSFRDHRFVVRFFDVPGMKHQMASPETFERVIEWVEANNPRL
jgi:predicted esterase